MDKDTTLNVIQIKKLSSLVSWFRQRTQLLKLQNGLPSPKMHSGPGVLNLTHLLPLLLLILLLLPLLALPLPIFGRESSPVFLITSLSRIIAISTHDSVTFRQQLAAIMLTMSSILAYMPSTSKEVARLKFVYSVLEQKVLTPDVILTDTVDVLAVYADLVDRYGKSRAAQLAASELESDLAAFRIDASWTKTNLAFLITWTIKTLDLDSVLEQPITESWKHIWFTRAVATKAVSLTSSQFDTSKRLTAIGIGSCYTKTQLSILYDHVKDDAIWADRSEGLLQGTHACHVDDPEGSCLYYWHYSKDS